MSSDEAATPSRSLRQKQLRLLVGVPALAIALAALVVLTVVALRVLI